MSNSQLSIVVPVFNVDPWLRDCLDSIQRQTFTAWKCILVDDGSTDFSGIICDSYAHKDSRFKVIHQKNAGVSAARNVGIKAEEAPMIAFIDPDDYVSDNYFEAQVSAIKRIDAEVSVARPIVVEETGTEGKYFLENLLEHYQRKNTPKDMLSNEMVQEALCNNLFSCVSWGKVYTKTLWSNTLFPLGIDLGEDMMTVPGTIIKAQKAVYVDEAVYYWRQRSRSLLHGTVSYERLIMDIWASSQMLKQLCEYSPLRKEKFEGLKFQYDMGCLDCYLKSNPNARKGKSALAVFKEASRLANQYRE